MLYMKRNQNQTGSSIFCWLSWLYFNSIDFDWSGVSILLWWFFLIKRFLCCRSLLWNSFFFSLYQLIWFGLAWPGRVGSELVSRFVLLMRVCVCLWLKINFSTLANISTHSFEYWCRAAMWHWQTQNRKIVIGHLIWCRFHCEPIKCVLSSSSSSSSSTTTSSSSSSLLLLLLGCR